jgi:peptidyl-prolyl cis-trans isomerase C
MKGGLKNAVGRILREPLLHFLAIGAALFVAYDLTGNPLLSGGKRIVVTAADQQQLIAVWERQWQRPPTPREMEGLVEGFVREEVLYREAKAMGLGEGDTIVRRRLAQKMLFLAEDTSTASEPSDADLERFLRDNPDLFRQAPRITFSHVYVSRDRHRGAAEGEARRILEALRRGDDPAALGDRFMLQKRYVQRSEREIDQLFGAGFAARLRDLPLGSWQGPVASSYGLHLVRVEDRVESRAPALDEVRQRVRDELLARRRHDADEALYRKLRSKYQVTIEGIDRDVAAVTQAGGGSVAGHP